MSEFDNINGIYAKDATLREGIATLRNTVTSQTIKPLTVTQNGAYTADPSEGTYGYSPITVDVQEQPWQPLEDGYSNFWFELTNDTLSPWLNFSAKNNDAVIDWGDGSGEVALDTLTPTHTYSKAGKYVVKVKGVTGIARQHSAPYIGEYMPSLQYVELSADVDTVQNAAFIYCTGLKAVALPHIDISSTNVFYGCSSLTEVAISYNTTIPATFFYYCFSLAKLTIPSTVASVGSSAFAYAISLREIYCQATVPPTIANNTFSSLPSDFIIYVPVGYGETYKSASGWSTYADHILEEGQTPNRAMLSRLAKAVETDTDEDMR